MTKERETPPLLAALLEEFDGQFGELNSAFNVDSKPRVKDFLTDAYHRILDEGKRIGGQEVAICAAIRTSCGKIIRGQRHSDCMSAARGRKLKPGERREDQGFITSVGRYVDRLEARKLQDAAGVVSVSPNGYIANTLFSEDLY